MVSRWFFVLVSLSLWAVTGCAAPDDAVGESVDNYTEKNIDFRMWDEPVELPSGRVEEASVAYGECEQVVPTDDDVDIQIHCGPAWTDVAWYLIPATTIEALASTGTLSVALAIPDQGDRLRGSIHRVSSAGDESSTVKLASRSMIFDGDTLEAPIEEIADHYLYLARGRDLINIWGTGEVAFSVALTE